MTGWQGVLRRSCGVLERDFHETETSGRQFTLSAYGKVSNTRLERIRRRAKIAKRYCAACGGPLSTSGVRSQAGSGA